jgi:tRNA A37 threonylcarbamoyladenosine synthetase subunit TsaC/SUA5/YrdC
MAQFFEIHPDNPQRRLIEQAVSIIDRGGLVIYPTDSSYALGCHIGDKAAMERIQRLRRTDNKHHFTLVCSDLSEIGSYAKVSNSDYRLMKTLTPGPYTFLLDNNIVHALLLELGQPIMSSTLIPPGGQQALDDAVEIREMFERQVDLVIDGGFCGVEPTTVISLIDGHPEILRHGRGDVSFLE